MNTIDTLGRPLRDLRISVTDKCNFRCVYCMPKEIFGRKYEFLAREKLLSFEELERLVRIFIDHGVEKIRLTGGEPLMRRDITKLIARLAQVPGVQDLTLTTNGSFPTRWVQLLKDAGLHRITVSLDSLDETVFRAMNDVDFPVARVLEWIEACDAAGLGPVKINMVVKRGVNEQSILPMARYFREQGHILRFIEYMDVGSTNGWQLDQVVSAAEIVKIIDAQLPIEPVNPNYYGEVANRWHYKDGSGEFGVVASVTQAFCNTCTRTRLSAEGKLYTCLFATRGHDFRALLRGGASDAEISAAIGKVWARRTDRYSEIRSSKTAGLQKIEMSYIGG